MIVFIIQNSYNETEIHRFEQQVDAETWVTDFQSKIDSGQLANHSITAIFDVRTELNIERVEVVKVAKLIPGRLE